MLLSGIGGTFGIAIGYLASRILPLWTGEPQPLDWRVIAFTAVLTLLTGLLFGIAPQSAPAARLAGSRKY